MVARTTQYMERAVAYPKRRPAATALGLGGLVLLAVAVALGIYFAPDFVRYMKIRSM